MDAEAAYQYLVGTRVLDPKSIIGFGQSLGTTVAAHVAAHHTVGGLVLEAPFPSASRVATKIHWFPPGLGLLVRGQFDTKSNLKKVTAPVLVIHCTRDQVLAFEFGREVVIQCHRETGRVRRERAVGQADFGANVGRVPPVPAVIRHTITGDAARGR